MYNDPYIVMMKNTSKSIVKINFNILTKMLADGITTIETFNKKYDIKSIITCCILALTPQYADSKCYDINIFLNHSDYHIWLYRYLDGNTEKLLAYLPAVSRNNDCCISHHYIQNMVFINGETINKEE